ncbi:hypothetical protein AHAS_Ahas15G0289200 [Arachis hypogaea]
MDEVTITMMVEKIMTVVVTVVTVEFIVVTSNRNGRNTSVENVGDILKNLIVVGTSITPITNIPSIGTFIGTNPSSGTTGIGIGTGTTPYSTIPVLGGIDSGGMGPSRSGMNDESHSGVKLVDNYLFSFLYFLLFGELNPNYPVKLKYLIFAVRYFPSHDSLHKITLTTVDSDLHRLTPVTCTT